VNGDGSYCNSTVSIEPTVIGQVTLANGSTYKLKYDSYANVSELHLPTGGFYKYSYGSWLGQTGNGGVTEYTVVPYLTERDVYLHEGDGVAAQVAKYTLTWSGDLSQVTVHVSNQDGQFHQLGAEDHVFVSPGWGPGWLPVGYNSWNQSKELSATYYAADGVTVLRSETSTWQQRPCSGAPNDCWFVSNDPDHTPRTGVNDPSSPPHDPQLAQKNVTVAGGSTSKSYQDKYYYSSDAYNNLTELDEYPFGNTTTPWRKTITAYKTDASYTQNSVHLISLPFTRTVTNGSGSTLSQTTYGYDETALQGAAGITSYDSTFTATTRGNITTVSDLLTDTVNGLNTTRSTSYGYDIAGNIVSMLDPRTVKRVWGYADSRNTYAFPPRSKAITIWPAEERLSRPT